MWLGGRSCTHVAQVTVTASSLLSSLLLSTAVSLYVSFSVIPLYVSLQSKS